MCYVHGSALSYDIYSSSIMVSIGILLEEEISAMKKELDKYGIQMPAFGKIGGILASEVCISCITHDITISVYHLDACG